MIPVCTVLFTVQNLQQCCTGVTTMVMTQLVDFVEKHQRIGRAGLDQTGNNPPGHSTNIGFPVTADICFIMDTAK